MRKLDPDVLEALREHARAQGRSLNSLICDILTREAEKLDRRSRQRAQRPLSEALAQAIFERVGEGTPAEELIREDRDR